VGAVTLLSDPARYTSRNKGARSLLTGIALCGVCGATVNAGGKNKSQSRLPVEVREQFLAALRLGQPFRQVLRDLGLTSNQVWGLTKTDEEWSAALYAALTATRRQDLQHGTNAAYAQGCVCNECRAHQRSRMARNR
jgi:hypothetical protein